MIEFELNGQKVSADVPPETSLLWVIREELGFTGTKFGCGKGLCGACTMHLNGEAIRTCIMPMAAIAGKKVTTIEGIMKDNLHPVQTAWIDQSVPQCGYCQPGQIMQAISYLNSTKKVDEESMCKSMDGNICRCGTYPRIKKAIFQAANIMGKTVENK